MAGRKIEIEMSKDIKAYEVRVIGPLTMRQLVCILIASMYGIPLLFILKGSFMTRTVIVIILMTPVILCGWGKAYGMPLEKYFFLIVKKSLISKNRVYETKNRYEYLLDTEIDEPEQNVNRRNERGYR